MPFLPHNDIIFWCILLAGFEVTGANCHLGALCAHNIFRLHLFWMYSRGPSQSVTFCRHFLGQVVQASVGLLTFCADQAVLGGVLLLTIGIGGPSDHIHICGITSRFLIEFHRFWYNWVVHPKRSKLSLAAKSRCWKCWKTLDFQKTWVFSIWKSAVIPPCGAVLGDGCSCRHWHRGSAGERDY